jgi:hypothetical protein
VLPKGIGSYFPIRKTCSHFELKSAEGDRNGQAECVKSKGLFALHFRQFFCVEFRLLYDPLPTPAGLLPRRNLHRLVGVFLDVADRELLALDLFRFVLSQNLNLFSAPGMTSLCGGVQTCDRPGKGNKSVGAACYRVSKSHRA